MFPTVREVLALDPVRHGGPRVVAGEDNLDRPVRWVHVAEVPDIATLLRGGELVLTTGIGLPADDEGLRAFVTGLADVGVSGLVVELGRRYPVSVPRVMVAAARRRGLPLVELRRNTPFVGITEAVHALIVDVQLTELRATEEIHQRFTELSVEGAEPAEVVRQTAALAGCAVVLENLSRQVLAYDAAGDSAELLLDNWEQHSRRVRPTGRTAFDPDTGWLVTAVGARGHDWGRLLLRWQREGPPPSPAVDPGRAGGLDAGARPADPPRRRGARTADPPHAADRAARPHPPGRRGGVARPRAGRAAGTPAPRRRRGPLSRGRARAGGGAGAAARPRGGGRPGAARREAGQPDQRAGRPGGGRAAGGARPRRRGPRAGGVRDGAAPGARHRRRRGRGRVRRRHAARGPAVAGRGAADRRRRPPRPARGAGVPAAARRSRRVAAPAARRAAAADVRRAGAGAAAGVRRPAPARSSCSGRCGPTSTRAATSPPRRRRRTCPGRPSTSGWPGSPGSSAPTSTRSTPACRCTWRCWRSTPSATPEPPGPRY